MTDKNYRKTARVFGPQDSTVRKVYKAAPQAKTKKGRFGCLKRSKRFQGNKNGVWAPLSYLMEIDQEILENPNFKKTGRI